jgi:hypothetical protein
MLLIFASKEEHTLRVFENRVLRRIFGTNSKGDEFTDRQKNCIMRNSILCKLHQTLLG